MMLSRIYLLIVELGVGYSEIHLNNMGDTRGRVATGSQLENITGVLTCTVLEIHTIHI